MTESSRLGLDDLKVGQRFRSGTHVVTPEEIKRYAAEFDPQPFHLDEAAGAASFFGGLAASGWHTAGITMRLLVDGGLPLKNGIIGGGELTVETEILSITPSRSQPDRAAVVVRIETRNGAGDLMQSFTPKLLVTR